MNIADLRQRYQGYSDDEIVSALQATKYPDFSVQEIKDVLGVKAPKRSLFAVANDTVIEAANAAAGTVGAVGNFIAPGNRASKFIDDSIIKPGEQNQSDAVKADKSRFRDRMESADGIVDELGAVGGYITDAPLQALAQAAGSFAVPAGAITGAGALARAGGAGARGVTRAGLGGGVAIGAAGAGGDAAGTAYELSTKAGATDEQATAAARGASVIPALIGGVGGLVGAERLVAGAGGFKGSLMSRALKTGAAEGLQEGLEEGVTQYEGQRAAMPFDPTINPAKGVAGAAAMGAALGFATGAGAAALVQQRQADAGLSDLTTATTGDEMRDAALRATAVPLEVPPSGQAIDRDGVILPPNAGPRAVNGRAIDEIRQLDPAQQQEALGLQATIDSPRASPAVRRYAQNALDAMLLPVRQIPTGDATELAPTIPVGETQELSSTEAAGQYLQPPDREQRANGAKRVPVGDATEIDPERMELEQIPERDVIEERPVGMAERTRTPESKPVAKPMDDAAIVKAVVDGFRGTNTPQARAFVQGFEAGRIKPSDVLKLIGRPPASPDERLAAAAAQAPKPAADGSLLLTVDGQPYGTRSGAYVRAKKEGGEIVTVAGGWAVRPKESASVDQRNVDGAPRGVVAPGDGRAPEPVGSVLDVGRVASDAGRGNPAAAGVAVASGGQTQPADAGGRPEAALSEDRADDARAINERILALKAASPIVESKRQFGANDAPKSLSDKGLSGSNPESVANDNQEAASPDATESRAPDPFTSAPAASASESVGDGASNASRSVAAAPAADAKQLQDRMAAAGWKAEVAGPGNTIWTRREGGERYTALMTPAAGTKPARMEVTALVDAVDTQIDEFDVGTADDGASRASKAVADDLAETKARAQADAPAAEQAPATPAPAPKPSARAKPAPTNDPFANNYADLVGKIIEQRITTDDGKTAILRMDAAVVMRDFDSRETTLNELRLCLGRGS